MIFAGTPATIECDGMSFVTTAFAPITTSSPIVILPMTLAPAYIVTLLPIVGIPAPPHAQ